MRRKRLDELIDRGRVWFESDHVTATGTLFGFYVGRAEDGVVVALGNDREDTEKYLRACPNPSDW